MHAGQGCEEEAMGGVLRIGQATTRSTTSAKSRESAERARDRRATSVKDVSVYP